MKISRAIPTRLKARLFRITYRKPNVTIGGNENPYLLRWFVIPRNRLFNIYLHCFKRSDDDRALHDHPWFNLSILLVGAYTEHRIKTGGIHAKAIREAGELVIRGPRTAHRLELHQGDCWTLFITGPRLREWGFHCSGGWVHWKDFTSADGSEVGSGCDALTKFDNISSAGRAINPRHKNTNLVRP
jgi:hypothetical protein